MGAAIDLDSGQADAGHGAEMKDNLHKVGPWKMVLATYAESLPRASDRLTLDPVKTDAHGMAALHIAFDHGANERAALADAKTMLEEAPICSISTSRAQAAPPFTEWVARAWEMIP